MPNNLAAQEMVRDERKATLSFKVDQRKTLAVPPLAVYNVRDALECTWKCLQNFNCWSFNLAIQKLKDLFSCEILSAERYNSPLKLEKSNIHHHYFIKVRMDFFLILR